jgi:hypothetical protein
MDMRIAGHWGGSSALRLACVAGTLTWFCSAPPLRAIDLANPSYNPVVGGASPVAYGVDLSGVVELITSTDIGCSGTLLSDGFSVLTAGHCVNADFGAALPTGDTAYFTGPDGTFADPVSAYFVDPGWTGNALLGGDLAVLRLSQQAPAFATRYSLYSGTAPLDSALVVAGYGLTGTGTTGATGGFGTLRVGTNEYVTLGSAFKWTSSLLVGEFYDSAVPNTNALGVADPYSAFNEVDIAEGDSGGPSFYDGEIVGVHDLGICHTDSNGACTDPPALGSTNTSYFGDLFADTSVSANLTWIEDQELAPEPASLALIGLGLAIMVVLRFSVAAQDSGVGSQIRAAAALGCPPRHPQGIGGGQEQVHFAAGAVIGRPGENARISDGGLAPDLEHNALGCRLPGDFVAGAIIAVQHAVLFGELKFDKQGGAPPDGRHRG